MLYRLLVFILLAVMSLFAQNVESPKSRLVVQADLDYTKLFVTKDEYTFNGNGDIWLQLGREFRFSKFFSWTPSFGLNRNGWSFKRVGHTGSISYITPYVSASLNMHLFDIGYVDAGMYYGRATFCFGEVDGKNTTDDDEYFATYNIGFFTHAGVEFLKNFRAGLVWRYAFMNSEPVPTIKVYALGGFFAYTF